MQCITCIPSIAISAFERVVLFVRVRLLLSETEELRHWHNEQRTEGFSLVGLVPLGTYIIVIAVRGCGTTYIRNTSVESILTTDLRLGQRFRILLR